MRHPVRGAAYETPAMGAALCVASANAGKVREFAVLWSRLGISVTSVASGVEETGRTFIDNARLKAVAVARRTGQWALGDDSGLCVVPLDGEPGLRTGRFAQEQGGYVAAARQLWTRAPHGDATYHCALALVAPDGRRWDLECIARGRLIAEPWMRGPGFRPMFATHDEQSATDPSDTGARWDERSVVPERAVAVERLWAKLIADGVVDGAGA